MQNHGLRAQSRRGLGKPKTTVVDGAAIYAPNLLGRKFLTKQPNLKWVGDITCIKTTDGVLFRAVLIDIFSRRVVGWETANLMPAEFTRDALKMILKNRDIGLGLIHHTDRGSQYTSHEYQQALSNNGLICSMSRKGKCWDNAVAESFFGRLKEELTHGRKFESHRQAADAVNDCIQRFYNPSRRQKRLGNLSPAEYEVRYAALLAA